MRGLSCASHQELRPDGERAGVGSRLRRHAALVGVVAAAVLLAAVVAGWTALRPAASERNPLPEPIRIGTSSAPGAVPGPGPDPQLPSAPGPAAPGTDDVSAPPAAPPTSANAVGPADVVPPPPLPDDDADDDGDDRDDDGGDDDGGDD